MRMRGQAEEFLDSLCIDYDHLVMKPVDWAQTMPEWKVKAVRETNVQLMFDDEEPNCRAIQQQTPCLAAHVFPIPQHEAEIEELKRISERRRRRK